jgi:copper homeostasis protein
MIKLEICTFSLQAAINAEKSGADRIELCKEPSVGGTTPDYALLKMVCEKLTIPVFSIIRPRGGDFLYDDNEFEMMKLSISQCKDLGCKGVAFSVLLPDNRIDTDRTSILVELAYPMESTFIRGFDLTPDPFEALEDVKKTGCKRILTSGLTEEAIYGSKLIKKLVDLAEKDIIIMPCSGINKTNLKQIIIETGAKEFHVSARKMITNQNKMIDNLGFGNYFDCNTSEIKAMKKITEFEN